MFNFRTINFYEKTILKLKKYKTVQNFFIVNSEHTKIYFKKSVPRKIAKNIRLIQYGFDFPKFHNQTTIIPKDKLRLINKPNLDKGINFFKI